MASLGAHAVRMVAKVTTTLPAVRKIRGPDLLHNYRRVIGRGEMFFGRLPRGLTQVGVMDAGSGIKGEWLLRTANPEDRAVVLYLHGGGYVAGSPSVYRTLTGALCRRCKAGVFALDYRLAPEHRFPAALQDAVSAYRWLLSRGAAPQDIVIAGDSAGGGLALCTLLALRDADIPPPAGAVLIAPWVDLASRRNFAAADRGESRMARAYVGDGPLDDPLASGLYGNLQGLPPLMIQASANETLRDDAMQLDQKARDAGGRYVAKAVGRRPACLAYLCRIARKPGSIRRYCGLRSACDETRVSRNRRPSQMPLGRALTLAALAGCLGVSPALYQGMQWRFVGPLRGGRTTSIAGVAGHPNLFYIGVVNGGIWKTDDAGRTWMPIFDGQPTGSIGALAIASGDPNVIYAGSGEGLQRPDLAIGDGIYRSRDGGATWTHLGLRDGQQIPAIAVDPNNPNRLFVAVLGHPYGPNDERGIYRSIDGGATFTRVLFKNADIGAFAVVLDPRSPQVVYATLWAARQAPWEIGGSFEIPGSGIFKSTDGGNSWAQLTTGLPTRIGRAELAVAPSNPNTVYAYIDTPDDGASVYRSDNAGASFTRTNHDARIAQRGDDLASITVDPRSANVVYITNTSFYRSQDGARTFTPIKGAPGGDDYHGAWVNPNDSNVIAVVSDQGATLSVNHGATWSSWYNQPTAQLYHASADDRFPYLLCSGQQESGSACVSSRGGWGQVTQRDWHTAGAEEYGYVIADPLHPGIFFGGKVQRFDERTGAVQQVSPIAIATKGRRTVRTQPLAFDHFDRRRLYFAANVVFATDDGGRNWRTISPDLTREHPGVPPVLGPFEAADPQHGTHRGVVYALAPSYRHAGTIWAGTDDGFVWVTRDGGRRWSNVTPPALTPWSKVSQIDASRVDDDTAFVAVNRFRLNDLRPYVYVTRDGGAHWQLQVDGLPDQPVNAVRQDPLEPRLLYASTENGVYASFDAGAHWQSLQLNLPRTSARDLIVHANDVIVATHGRGFWILDDVTPLRQLAAAAADADALAAGGAYLFAPETAVAVRNNVNTDTPLTPEEPAGQNPPDGAILNYALARAASHVALTIFDDRGRLMRRYTSDDPITPPIPQLDKPEHWERPFRRPPTTTGMHRFVWDLRQAAPHSVMEDLPIAAVIHDTPRVPQGVFIVPGRYAAELDVDGVKSRRLFSVAMDPRVSLSVAALERQHALAEQVSTIMDDSYRDAASAKASGHRTQADALATINETAASLLDAIDGVAASPTAAQASAVTQLELQLRQVRARLTETPRP